MVVNILQVTTEKPPAQVLTADVSQTESYQ